MASKDEEEIGYIYPDRLFSPLKEEPWHKICEIEKNFPLPVVRVEEATHPMRLGIFL